MSESVRVLDVQVFPRLRAGLRRFQVNGLEILESARARARRSLEERLAEQRRRERAVGELQARLAGQGQGPGAADLSSQLEQARRSAEEWRRQVFLYQQRLERFESQARAFRSFLEVELPRGESFLSRVEAPAQDFLQGRPGLPVDRGGSAARKGRRSGGASGFLATVLSFLVGLLVPPLVAFQIGPLSISIGITGISIGLPLVEIGGCELGLSVSVSPDWDPESERGWQFEAGPLISPPFIPA